jgi:outer membrane protein assembly factor BamB
MMNSTFKIEVSRAVIVAIGIFLGCACASDWPQYKRDSARAADASDEVLSFPLQRVLAAKFSAPIYSSAAVVDGKVYVVDERGLLACIDAARPKVLWSSKIGGVANRSSPAVAVGKIFVGSTAGYLLVADAATGKEIARVPAEGGVIAAPAVANDAVYCLSFNGKMLKVDFSGKLVWVYDGGKASNGEFVVHGKFVSFQAGPVDEKGPAEPLAWYVLEDLGDHAERKQFLRRGELEGGKVKLGSNPQTSESGLLQLDSWVPQLGLTSRGTSVLTRDIDLLVWFGPNGGRTLVTGCVAQPVLSKEHVIIGDNDGRMNFFNYTLEKNQNGKPVWTYETSRVGKPNGGISATAAVSGGTVYFGGEDGIFYGLGHGTEAQVVSVLPSAPPLVQRPGEALTGCEWPTVGGDMSYAAISPEKNLKPPFKMFWKTRIAGTSGQNNVVVAAGMVYVASYNGYLEAVDAASGEIVWRTYQPGIRRYGEYGNDGPLTYADGKLLIVRRNGLWCHDAKTGDLLWRNAQPVLPVPGGAPQGDGLVVTEGKVLIGWYEKGDAIEVAALDLGTGKESWHVKYEGVVPPKPTDVAAVTVRVCQGALGEKTWFLSVCANRGTGEGPLLGGSTIAVNPADGKLLWKNTEKSINGWGGLNYRNGVVVVHHSARGWQAFDARTGKFLWESPKFAFGGPGAWHLAPLTDEFLATQGAKGVVGGYCTDVVYANGYVYGPPGSSSHVLSARKFEGGEVWRHVVISRGCAAPAPAYGRLYYTGSSEGVVYCFVNIDSEK